MQEDKKHIDIIGTLARFFSGEATVEEQITIDKWKASCEENQQDYDAYQQLWDITGSISDKKNIEIDTEWNKLDNRISASYARTVTVKRIVKIASACLMISILAFVVYLKFNFIIEKNLTGEIKEIELPDGSSVTLNYDTKIRYRKDFGNTNRDIYLLGEAFFDVKKENKVPFIVSTERAQIEVLGTRFNVKTETENSLLSVYVQDGSLTLYDKKQKEVKTLLSSGEKGWFNKKNNTVTKEKSISANDVAWINGFIEFDNTPLIVVKEVLESTYHKKLQVSAQIKQCEITATFNHADLQVILDVLSETLNLQITNTDNTIVLKGDACKNE